MIEEIYSPDKDTQLNAVHKICNHGPVKEQLLLLKYLTTNRLRIGNSFALVIQALGNSDDPEVKNELINIYDIVNTNEKKMIIEALIKTGAFKKFFGENLPVQMFLEKLWPLLFSCSSDQLRDYLALDKAAFLEKLQFAQSITKHWRK